MNASDCLSKISISLYPIVNSNNVFADTPEDNGVKNYTFVETPTTAQEIPRETGISAVTIKADSTIVEYNDGQIKEFDNNEYKINATVLE